MEWLLLGLVCLALFAVGYALPKWWVAVAPLVLAAAAYAAAQTSRGTDSDGTPNRDWGEFVAFLVFLTVVPIALGVVARTSRRRG